MNLYEQWYDRGNYWEHGAKQGSDDWLKVRIGRITGSVAGAMAGRSKFKSPEEQGMIIAGLKQEIFNPKNLEIMNHGSITEPDARKWYMENNNCKVVERGLIIPKWDITLGASVDGDVIGTDGIIEIKCPLKMYGPIQNYMEHIENGWNPPEGYVDHIWKTHYDQCQLGMAVMGKKWCDYIVYCTPYNSIFTQRIPFNPIYWSHLYPKLQENYNLYVKPYLDINYPILPIE